MTEILPSADPAEAAKTLDASPGDVVVAVPVFGAVAQVERCLRSVFQHSPDSVAVLVVDDGTPGNDVVAALERAAGSDARRVVLYSRQRNGGFVAAANDALAIASPGDVILLNSDVEVSAGWVDRLRDAAYSSSTIASASALSNNATILSVPERNRPAPGPPAGLTLTAAAERVAAASARLRPRIPAAIGHCVYLRRDALDAVGLFDPAFGRGYGEEVDWSLRAVEAGFEHVAADDVFVFHQGGASFGAGANRERLAHEALLDSRYPYYAHWVSRVARDEGSALAAALGTARVALVGLHLAVDAMVLHPIPTGTQIGVLATIRALAAMPDVARLDVLVRGHIPDYARETLDDLPHVRTILTEVGDAPIDGRPADVVFRPYQVTTPADVAWLRRMGRRVIVNQLDLIAYGNPAYFASDSEWLAYRDSQRLALAMADGVAFISEHSRESAIAASLLPAGRPTSVVYNGVEHYADAVHAVARPPVPTPSAGFLLMIGVPYAHKNRLFGYEVLAELRRAGWDGQLVLAGPTPTRGSSVEKEQAWLLAHPDHRESVVDLGQVSEHEKTWLYQNAGLVLYATTSEGFGLVPFEAASFGVPCLSTRRGGLDEVLPDGIPTIRTWDAAVVARTAHQLLDDETARTQLVQAVNDVAERFTWDGTARAILELCVEVGRQPVVSTIAVAGEAGPVVAPGSIDGATATTRALDATVTRLARNPKLRSWLAPPGSEREVVARRALDAWRRRR